MVDGVTAQRRLTASEREALMRLNVALEILVSEGEALAKRAKLVPHARRDLAMMAAVIRRLMGEFVLTIPPEQLKTYVNNLNMASYTIGVKRPGGGRKDSEYGLWLPYGILNELLEGLHDKCMMCDLDRERRRSCSLRKALTAIPNDAPERDDGDCPYFTVL